MFLYFFLLNASLQQNPKCFKLLVSRKTLEAYNEFIDEKRYISENYKFSCLKFIDKTNVFLKEKYYPDQYAEDFMKYVNIALFILYKQRNGNLYQLILMTAVSIYLSDGFLKLDVQNFNKPDTKFSPRGIFQINTRGVYELAGQTINMGSYFLDKPRRLARISEKAIKASIFIMNNFLENISEFDFETVISCLEVEDQLNHEDVVKMRMSLLDIFYGLKKVYEIEI